MAENPEFNNMAKLVTPKEIAKYLNAPDVTTSEKEFFNQATYDVKQRFVAGWMIRNKMKIPKGKPKLVPKALKK